MHAVRACPLQPVWGLLGGSQSASPKSNKIHKAGGGGVCFCHTGSGTTSTHTHSYIVLPVAALTVSKDDRGLHGGLVLEQV